MDKGAIRDELNKIRSQIKTLKSDFSKKRDDKETHFKKGEEYSEKINSLYEEIKKIETENNLDKINLDLEKRKKDYEELKKSLEELDKEFLEIKKNHKTSVQRSEPVIKTITVEKAKKEIKQLDTKLQTQVLNLEKESELIKKIEQLKEIVGSVSGNKETSGHSDKFKEIKKKLSVTRKKFYNVEKKIRSLYKQIRLISKQKKEKYKEIDNLRNLKKKVFETFRLTKGNYSELGKELRDLFKTEEELMRKLGESPIQKKRSNEKELRVKQREAEDKLMKKGATLTTEDLLLFQKK